MSFLIGKWEGQGEVVDSNPVVKYSEVIEIKHLKGPVHAYTQFTKKLPENTPLHSEMGYIRIFPQDENTGKIEFCLTQPFGVCNIEEGTYDNTSVQLKNTQDKIIRTESAKQPYVQETARKLYLNEQGNLNYRFELGTANYQPRHHLQAKLTKIQ